MALVVLAVAAVAWGVGIWRFSSLAGLPDIGDPFDVRAFLDAEIPDGDNAYVLYDRAFEQLKGPGPLGPDGWPVLDWSGAGPEVRSWLEANREAMDLWRRGTERPDARPKEGYLSISAAALTRRIIAFADFAQLAALEASRLRSEGDVEGAWGWYRAALRSSAHFGRREAHDPRIYASDLVRLLIPSVLEWAGDPKVDAPLLRRATADVAALDALMGPDSDLYKQAYVLTTRGVEADAKRSTMYIGPEVFAGLRLPPSANPSYVVLKNEPERSRRVLRLLFANWLSQADEPPSRRGRAIFAKYPDPIVYETGPDDPPSSRVLPLEDVARWYRSSMFAFFRFLGGDGRDYCRRELDKERATRGRLLAGLAAQLYRREHGTTPESPRSLIAPYLEGVPEAEPVEAEPRNLLLMLRARRP